MTRLLFLQNLDRVSSLLLRLEKQIKFFLFYFLIDMEEDYIALGSDENDKSGQLDEDERPYHYPWWEQTTDNTMASFQAEIEDFVNFLQPTQEEINIRHYLIHKIRYHIRQRWSDAKVHVFGSFKTNTFLPDSDMDLMVELPGYPTSSDLYTVASVLYQAKVSKRYPTVIGKATVPVVKFEERLTGLKVDIILNSFGGVDCATYVSRKLSEYPGARQLTLIIKHIVALREVNEVYTGGIGGFGVVCMVISFLQMHPMVASGTIDPQKNLGTLLLDFLQLYGIHFAVGKVAISVSHKGKYYPKMTNCLRQGKPVFSIEDPLDAKNDIGVKSFNALTVVKVFRRAYVDMTNRAYAMLRSTQPKKECLLTYIGYIPESMIQQRNIIAQAYDEQLWQDDPAADSFVWPT
ncbi:uncharacterized protein BX664DRAFT_339421 [Halteromyces radiatus]|uniref:uncharacterized protein n=1 Tax=Halteromyces radiatus TaxID=101107 RepID=UPI002220E3BD|nr:uncharacterized protein BX664DRAFT_339421 [Halteromyces radiatus]KAI8082924.1 hypothetical protein BX664DRAFT_339421 [Halteromyces radiatus]